MRASSASLREREAGSKVHEGTAFSLWLDTHKLHLFDAKTGNALGR
jgi:hypothetical protein